MGRTTKEKSMKSPPKTYYAYLKRLIEITNRCITKDAHLLSKETLDFHKGANNAYRSALKQYKAFHVKKSFEFKQ
jgi:hypothetical protein